MRRLIYELRELGIEASEEGGSSLDDSAAVRLIMSLIQLADHPGDRVARFHIATSPLHDWGLARFAESAEQKVPVPFTDATLSDAVAGRLARHVRRQLIDDGYGPTVYTLVQQLAPSCNRRELRRLEKLIGLAYQYDETATTRPRDFATYVETAKVRDPIAAAVRVMTVHQAKGLEFDIVVLADMDANLIGQRDDLVVGRPSATEPIDRTCRRCNKDVRNLLPDSWQKLFHQTDDRDVAESLCVLYVAATRAIHTLHMIVAPSSERERSIHKTFAGLLRSALTDGTRLEPQQIAYETGNRDWFRSPGVLHEPSPAEVAAKTESLAPLEVKLASPTKRRWRGLQRISPSSLEGGTQVRLSDHSTDGGLDRAFALARGTLIHAWFEQIRWLDDGPPDDNTLAQIAAEQSDVNFKPAELKQAIADFRAMLSNENIANQLKRSDYQGAIDQGCELKVENEFPIAFRDDDSIVTGNIDRLVIMSREGQVISADIVDFKTDVLTDNSATSLQSKVTYYRPQIETYRRAIASMFGLQRDAIGASLLFVGPGKHVSI